ncbi:hypothetical protein CBM2608_B130128 [Cupriavidus taiwanensis]|nr:hypothetical protein CBM2608_B130128 [Cupriavidus taiwanensis]
MRRCPRPGAMDTAWDPGTPRCARDPARDGHAILPDFSRGGLVQARDQAQQRGLAAAAGTEQGDEFTRRDGEVDVVEYRQPVGAVAKPVADLPDIDAGAGSCCRVINCRRVNSPLPRAGEGLRERASVCSTNTA